MFYGLFTHLPIERMNDILADVPLENTEKNVIRDITNERKKSAAIPIVHDVS